MTAAAPVLLVVDDDQVARELLAETLGREGYRVHVAGGGEEALRLGGAGCISATANVNVAHCASLMENWKTPVADAMQGKLTAIRAAIQKFPMVAANKAILAELQAVPDWSIVRPPLRPLLVEARAQLLASLEPLHFIARHPVSAA